MAEKCLICGGELSDEHGPTQRATGTDIHEHAMQCVEQLARRLAALEAAAKRPSDLSWAEKYHEDDPSNPHPAYECAAEWKDKAESAQKELSDERARIDAERVQHRQTLTALDEQRKRAEAAELQRDEEQCTAYAKAILRQDANAAAADTLAKLRDGRAILVDDKEAWLTCIAPTQIAEWQKAADTLERLRRGDGVDGKWLVSCGGSYNAVIRERDALAAKVSELQSRLNEVFRDKDRFEQDAATLKTRLADTEAKRVAAEELVNATEADVRILEGKLRDSQRNEATAWACANERSDTIADLERRLSVTETECRNVRNARQASERDADRWRDIVALWRRGDVLTVIEMLAAEKEAKHGTT